MGSCMLAAITIGHVLIRNSCSRFSEGEATAVSHYQCPETYLSKPEHMYRPSKWCEMVANGCEFNNS